MLHSQTKHIEIRNHLLRDTVEKGDIIFEYMDMKNQLADNFTKSLSTKPFRKIHMELGILDYSCYK